MNKLNFTNHQTGNNTKIIVFGVVSLVFSLAGLFFLPLSILGVIFGHLASNNHTKALNIYAKSGLVISYGWLIFSFLSILVYMLLK